MPAPAVVNRLPLVSNLLKWFKGDDLTIDNALFKLHHQATTFIVMFGLLFIFVENHFDGRAIICQGGDHYAKSYCWIHGTAYVLCEGSPVGQGPQMLCGSVQDHLQKILRNFFFQEINGASFSGHVLNL